MTTPLEGVTIVDFTIWLQSFGVTMLADMGAEVIKVEELPAGDPLRDTRLTVGLDKAPSPINFRFEVTCRGKKSVAINLKEEEGRQVVRRLVDRADVFISNRRQGALEHWGLSYQSLSKGNPRLIYLLDSGWGPRGPDRDLPGMDLAVQARGGLMSMMNRK